jgi:transcriptional regulator GlxA family with amidase domain
MNRRQLLRRSGTLGLAAAFSGGGKLAAGERSWFMTESTSRVGTVHPLKPPAEGPIPVAFLISDGAVLIDFAGPWEVFGNVMIGNRMDLFQLYTVAETLKPIRASGGMQIIPDYTLETAPPAKVVVLAAQSNDSEPALEWIRKSSKMADLTMSVCTGAYLLAKTGLLAGKSATTHHGSYIDLATRFPDLHVKRGARFVDDGNLASSGGLSCGIDLAFHVVERYFGRAVATQAAYDMEYQGRGWMDANSNMTYAQARTGTASHPVCAVCSMAVDKATAPSSAYKGKTYYFCSTDHQHAFDATPAKYVEAAKKQ